MDLSQRYKQAAEEARWALGLAIFYVIGWCILYLFTHFVCGHWVLDCQNCLFRYPARC